MANKIVKDFEFSGDRGFTRSAGKVLVHGYSRGGKVTGQPETKIQPYARRPPTRPVKPEVK